jgi:uncharacterized protein (DUF433 family)
MTLTLHADVPPLRTSADGVMRVGETRIPLERIIRAFLAGATPEQIVHDFDVLSVEEVYAVVNYYLHHRSEVDAYVAAADQDESANRDLDASQANAAGIRARLLARDAGGAR